MADPSEDKIDFKKLERELSAAVESDAHYWRENDAKMRAVEQRVETYEQFRDMVAAAHIKPLDKDDKVGMMVGRNQPWNPYYSKANDGHQNPKTDSHQPDKDSCVLPANSNDFTKQWRKLRENCQKYNFLISIGGDKLAKIFHAEISFGLLGDILIAFNQCLEPSDVDTVVQILTCLSETNRFTLSLDFLSKTERSQCSELIYKLEDHMGNSSEVVTELEDCVTNSSEVVTELEDPMANSSEVVTELEDRVAISSEVVTELKDQMANTLEVITGLESSDDEADNGSLSGNQRNENCCNSKRQIDEAVRTLKKQLATSPSKTLVDKETMERIKQIYKVFPLGR